MVDETSIVEAVDNYARGVTQHHVAFSNRDGSAEEVDSGGELGAAEPLFGAGVPW
jgi:hypothetical protein